MKKKRFIDRYHEYWKSEDATLEDVGSTNIFDMVAIWTLKTIESVIKVIGFSFLCITSVLWLPIYGLYCWITERRYRND